MRRTQDRFNSPGDRRDHGDGIRDPAAGLDEDVGPPLPGEVEGFHPDATLADINADRDAAIGRHPNDRARPTATGLLCADLVDETLTKEIRDHETHRRRTEAASTAVNPWTALQAGTSLIADATQGLPSPITPTAAPTPDELIFASFNASGRPPMWMGGSPSPVLP